MERAKLTAARNSKHWTLGEAAEKLRISLNTLYKWEHGKATPRPCYIRALCDLYGLSAYKLDLEECEDAQLSSPPIDEQHDELCTPNTTTALFQQDLELRLLCLLFQWLHSPQHSHAALQVRMNIEIERHDMNSNQ